MSAFFGLIGILALIVGLIMLVVSLIRKKSKKTAGIVAGVGLVLFIIGLSLPSSSEVVDRGKEKTDEKVAASKEENANEDEEVDTESEKEIAKREEAEKKEKEETKKAKEEKEAKEKDEKEKKEQEEFENRKANAEPIDYKHLAKNPDRHAGEYVKYAGEIIEIHEADDITQLRLALDDWNEEVLFVEYEGYTDFVDGDNVTVYGEIYGTFSYTSQAGWEISVPAILADTIE